MSIKLVNIHEKFVDDSIAYPHTMDAVTNSVRLDKLMPLYLILWYIFKAKNTEKIGTCQIIDEK